MNNITGINQAHDDLIPQPAIKRLCLLYQFLEEAESNQTRSVSSSAIGRYLGVGPHSVRKDIGYLGEAGISGAAYNVSRLKALIASRFGFGIEKRACVVGLGRLGQALLQHDRFSGGEFRIMAGFDSSINRLETIKTDIDVFPAHEIAEIVRSRQIVFALLTVPAKGAQETADRLVDGGIRGIVNFAPVVIVPKKPEIYIRNVDVIRELRILSANVKLAHDAC